MKFLLRKSVNCCENMLLLTFLKGYGSDWVWEIYGQRHDLDI